MPIISKKSFILLFVFTILFFAAASISYAAELTIFGPQKYQRTKGNPNEYSGNFTGLFTDVIRSGRLIILNGNLIGESRIEDAISSAEIYINGELIFGPSDFNKKVYRLEATVMLQEINSFYIKLQSTPGSYITVRLLQDISPPSSSIRAEPEAVKANEDSTLTWGSMLAVSCSIEPGIGNVDCNGVISVSPEETTAYIFTATGPGGSTTSSATITHINSVPIAHDQSVVTNEDVGTPIKLSGSDPDSDSLLYRVVSYPSHGAISGEPPNLSYVPDADYSGTDYFTFSINDGSLDSEEGRILINIQSENDVPAADAGNDRTVFKGDIVWLDGSLSSDIDGDPLSFQWIFNSVPPGSHSSFINPGASNTSFIPDESGTYRIGLIVNDGTTDSVPGIVTITANPRIIELPDVTGMSRSDAESILVSAGFDIGVIANAYDDTIPENHVVSQAPVPGAMLEMGSSVDLIISLGPYPLLGNGEVSGKVINALTGSVLPYAEITLYKDLAGETPTVISQYTAQEDGVYIFSKLTAGSYAVRANLNGFIAAEYSAILETDESSVNQDIILSPEMSAGEIRIVLSWGESPEDLESHLTSPNVQGCRYHCYFDSRDIPGANLDLDDMDSYGPETITITSFSSGTYRYYVHDFTNRASSTSRALSMSGARVKIYFGSGEEPVEFIVPDQAGTMWHVFDMDGSSQQIAAVNTMGFQEQPGEIDFPVITSSPDTMADLGELYSYTVEAMDPDLETLYYSLEEGPEGMSIDPLTGVITWPIGEDQGGINEVAVRVSDGRCGEDIQRFKINVTYLPVIHSFSSDPCSAYNKDGIITLTWSTERAESVSIDNGIGVVPSSGSITVESSEDAVVYTLTAENGSGRKQTSTPLKPVGTFYTEPSVLPATGGRATLTWNFPCALSCIINQGIGEVSPIGSMEIDVSVVPAYYMITAINASGSSVSTATIQKACADNIGVQISSPSVCTWSPGDSLNLTWKKTSGCIDLCEIDQGIGEVYSSGSLTVAPDQPTTYTISCSGVSGTGSSSVKVPSVMPLMINAFYAYPSYILTGQSIKLTWSGQCAETATIDNGIGEVPSDGSITVTPSSLPSTYTLTVSGKGETVTGSVTVNPKVAATFNVTPSVIKLGDSAVLSWTTVNADSCEITPEIGEVQLNGSLVVQPNKNTTYRFHAEGEWGTVTKYAELRYLAPTVQLQADREIIEKGESVTLSWVFSNAESCTIDNNIGEVNAGESIVVSPVTSTEYTMTATGPGGSATDSVKITVAYPPDISIIQPDGVLDSANQYYSIKWADEDADSNAEISLYYDTDGRGNDGVLIATGIRENSDPINDEYDRYIWDTSSMAEGDYYIYAVIDDGYHDPIMEYSAGPVTIDHSISAFKITALDGMEYDNFGNSVSLDQGYAIAGAYKNSGVACEAGAAYIFKQESESWFEQARLSADDSEDYDYFGYSVAISGEYAAVGAYGDDDQGNNSGAVYIFKRDGALWGLHSKLTAPNGDNDDLFGVSVSLSGDFLMIGAEGDEENGSIFVSDDIETYVPVGAAYIYKLVGSNWIMQKKLLGSNSGQTVNFGCSVNIKGEKAIAGAKGANNQDGRSYVFEYNGSEWIEKGELSASDDGSSSIFGWSVSIDKNNAIVGDPYHYNALQSVNYAGAAYMFSLMGTIWSEKTIFESADVERYEWFGSSVSIDGNHAIVGAQCDDDQGTNAGSAYLFEGGYDEIGKITSWTASMKLTAADFAVGDNFGSSVFLNDGYAIISATGDDDKGSGSGSAYIYPLYLSVRGIADPDIIEKGDSTILSWMSVFGDFCVIEPGIGVVNPNGSIVLSPTETTTYIITATGQDGSVSESVTLTVVDPGVLPSLEISASPETIGYSDSTVITWNSLNAVSCAIEPGIGPVSNTGSIMVSPVQDTTYTITGINSGGSASASVTVTVTCYNPIVSVDIEPNEVGLGDSAVISWNSKYTDYCEIQPDVGAVDANGSISVFPEDSLTYILTASGPCGVSTYNVPVTVNGSVSIEITYPDGVNEYADQACKINWTDKGPNIDAVISLYYDTDDSGYDGTLIVSGLNETPDGEANDGYLWDTSQIPEGVYYIYGVIDDGVNTPVFDYGDGPVNIIHFIPERLKVSGNNSLTWARFGYSAAMSGDYAIIGDTRDSAYIFKQEGTVWVRQSKLLIEGMDDVEGEKSVSIDGDYAIVGISNGTNSEGVNSGTAYIYKRQGDTWTEQARLEASDGESGIDFGYSVSINGGYAIIGASGSDNNDKYTWSSGAAYIFKREGTSWIEQAKLITNDSQSYDYFGYSVALSGDFAIIGAREDDNGNLSTSGSVYVFKREGYAWVQHAKLTPEDAASWEYFGSVLAIDGDYAVAGAPFNDNSGYTNSGAVYIFKRDGEIWVQQAKLIDPEPVQNGLFGMAAAINNNRIIIGGKLKAYVYQYDGISWNPQKKYIIENSSDVYGASVGISEDYALVGDYGDDDAGDASGAVYFYPLAFVDISAEPRTIQSGESAALTWFSTFADSCFIEPGIGSVARNGSISVLPSETTTYTITATGYGITATDQVAITVVEPLPVVTVTADPASINFTDSTLLSWNTIGATSCVIDNSIGNVVINGSISVSPSETTTYTLTATGPGGTATASVTVTVSFPAPAVTFTAEPQTINIGSSSVLTWCSQYAASCIIEPGIGAVDVGGTVTVSPAATTTYTISATGPGGTTSNEITITVNPSYVIINSPINGSTVYSPDIIVEGSIIDQVGETGVTVNGVVALVDGDYFAANNVPLQEGSNAITITVTSSDGTTTTSFITVIYQPSETYITMSVDDESGIAPFETALKIEGTFTFNSEPVITYTGPDNIVITNTENDNEYLLAMTTPGLYFLTAEVEYENGAYSSTIAVLVYDRETLDSLLKGKWNGMRSVLSKGNISGALEYIAEDARELYEYNFNLLNPYISEMTSLLRDDIEMDEFRESVVDYEMSTDFEGEIYICLIRFIKDKDGIWRISFF